MEKHAGRSDTGDLPQFPVLILSGGQTGADYGGLLAAKSLGIATGGVAPKGFRTENGPRPDLGIEFGLVESESDSYPPRTRENIRLCDVCILIASDFSATGTSLTKRIAIEFGKPVFEVSYSSREFINRVNLSESYLIKDIRTWLRCHKPSTINVAGNRESKARGIEQFTYNLIRSIFLDEAV